MWVMTRVTNIEQAVFPHSFFLDLGTPLLDLKHMWVGCVAAVGGGRSQFFTTAAAATVATVAVVTARGGPIAPNGTVDTSITLRVEMWVVTRLANIE